MNQGSPGGAAISADRNSVSLAILLGKKAVVLGRPAARESLCASIPADQVQEGSGSRSKRSCA